LYNGYVMLWHHAPPHILKIYEHWLLVAQGEEVPAIVEHCKVEATSV
jgi:hypothetical protein